MSQAQLERILDWIVHNFAQLFLIFSIFFQISPIKWNPITSFVKWIGKALTSSLDDKIDDIATSVDELRENVNTNEKDRIRWEILDFANSCRNGRDHSHDEFKHIVELHDKYKALLEETGDKNGVFDTEYKWIQALYEEKLQKNDFLK